MTENEIATILVNLFLKVHRSLDPGLLESVYEEVICYELSKLGLRYRRQQGMKVLYEEIAIDLGFRSDLIVEDKVIVEIKSIDALAPVHFKQVLTYLRLSK